MKNSIALFLLAAAFMVGVSSCNEAENPVKNEGKTIAENDNNVDKKVSDLNKIAAENKKKSQQEPASADPNMPKTSMDFEKMEHHFGTIDEGDSVEHVFKFTNSGDEDLIIEKCKGSCGCTVPQCPKEPIPPGGTGEIQVKFNSKGKKNHQEKRVTITANTEPYQTQLKIIADVTPAEGGESAAK